MSDWVLEDPTDEFAGALMQPQGDSNPDAAGSVYSNSGIYSVPGFGPGYMAPVPGFGPGDYSGGYTGSGDRVYWGPYGNQSIASTSTGSATTLLPPSQTTSVAAGTVEMQEIGENLWGDEQAGVSQFAVDDALPSSWVGSDWSGRGTDPWVSQAGASEPGKIAGDLSYRSSLDSSLTSGVPSDSQSGTYGGDQGGDAVPGGTLEMQPLGNRSTTPSGIAATESIYDGDSYYGTYTEDGGASAPSVGSVYDGDSYHGAYTDTDPSFLDTIPETLPDLPSGNLGAIELQPDAFSPENFDPEEKDQFVAGDDTNTSPTLLDDLPEVPEFYPEITSEMSTVGLETSAPSFSDFDYASFSPEMRAGFADFVGDPGNFSMGSGGVGMPMGDWLGFFRQRGIDLASGAILMPLFNWIDDNTDTPWVSRSIQGGLATLGLVVGGDPFGVIAAPIAWGIQEYMRQRQRLIDNDDPEAVQGRKFGYVREGDTWYPAFVTSRERDEGWLGSNKTQMTLEYGSDLRWKQKKGTDQWVPYFEDGTYKMKDFHTWDSYIDTDNEAGYDHLMQTDPLRDFYLLSDADTTKMLTGMAGGDTMGSRDSGQRDYTEEQQTVITDAQAAAYDSFKPYKDEGWRSYWENMTNDRLEYVWKTGNNMQSVDATVHPGTRLYYTDYVDQMQDLRKSFDFMQDYRYSDAGQIQASNYGENEFEGSRTLWKAAGGGVGTGDRHDALKSSGIPMANPQQGGLEHFQDISEMRFLVDQYVTAVDDLYGAQKRAGTSMGFNDLYDSTGVAPNMRDVIQDRGYMFYQDNAWEFGELDTADQLKDALRKIEESGDSEYAGTEHYRSADQRSYLSQKAYARYLHSKINQFGGADYLHGPGTPMAMGLNPFASARLDQEYDSSYMTGNQTQYSPDWSTERDWGFDPLYSKLDDADLPFESYGTDIVHRSEDWNERENSSKGARDYMYDQIQQTGVFEGEADPDYVAGRFKTQEAYNDWMPSDDTPGTEYYWDETQQDYVLPGEQGDDTYWDQDTRSYKPIPEEAPEAPPAATAEPSPGAKLPDAGPGDGAVPDLTGGGWAPPDESEDLWQQEQDREWMAQQADDQAAADKAAQDKAAQDKADADARAAEAAAAPRQTVPDETPGATAPHQEFHIEQHHEAMHLAADTTAPAHIKTI